MSTHPTPLNRHHRLRENYIGQVQRIGPFIEGSLCKVTRAGRTAASWQLTYKVQGKTHTVYVPKDMVQEVKEWIKNCRRMQRIIKEVSKLSMALIHHSVPESRAAGKRAKSGSPKHLCVSFSMGSTPTRT